MQILELRKARVQRDFWEPSGRYSFCRKLMSSVSQSLPGGTKGVRMPMLVLSSFCLVSSRIEKWEALRMVGAVGVKIRRGLGLAARAPR